MKESFDKDSGFPINKVILPLFNRASSVIEQARTTAYRQINETLVRRNWELGKMIAEEELKGEDRAKYGATIIEELSKRLTAAYGKGFTKRNLYNFLSFYKMYKALYTCDNGIVQSPIAQSKANLPWTHYLTLLQELNNDARQWYAPVLLGSLLFVPLQNFTSGSDIDWEAPIEQIDAALYAKYNLSDEEIIFIESMIKPML